MHLTHVKASRQLPFSPLNLFSIISGNVNASLGWTKSIRLLSISLNYLNTRFEITFNECTYLDNSHGEGEGFDLVV